MSLTVIFAVILSLAGLGLILDRNFVHLGIVVLLEGGVLFTLVDEKSQRTGTAPTRSV